MEPRLREPMGNAAVATRHPSVGTEPQPSLVASGRVRLSIVVPVYRGAATVGSLVEALSDLHPAGGLEIILVNDGSPDNSADVISALLPDARVPVTYIEHAR